MLSDALRALGYRMRTATNGHEALRIAEAFAPRVVLADLGLPIMDGYESAPHAPDRRSSRGAAACGHRLRTSGRPAAAEERSQEGRPIWAPATKTTVAPRHTYAPLICALAFSFHVGSLTPTAISQRLSASSAIPPSIPTSGRRATSVGKRNVAKLSIK